MPKRVMLMKNYLNILIWVGLLMIPACSEDPFSDDSYMEGTSRNIHDRIEPVAIFSSALPEYATKALIDNEVTQSFSANFLRIDEDIDASDRGLYSFTGGNDEYSSKINWENAYLVEASVGSTHSEEEGYRRSAFLNPVQTYKYKVTDAEDSDGNHVKDTTFYHTRLVSWYPQTCILHKNEQGTGAVTKFSDFNTGFGGKFYSASAGVVSVIFDGLDGEKDVMVSNVKEAQHWHIQDMHKDAGGTYLFEPYRMPFGADNYLTYKHYMSAVKVYAYAMQSEQMTQMWGKILKVIVKDQPSKVSVALPVAPSDDNVPHANVGDAESGVFGTAVFDESSKYDFPLVKTAMKGEYEEEPELPDDEPVLKEGQEVYLGYAMIRPDCPVTLEVHTEAGVFDVTVSNSYKATEASDPVAVFKAGYIYSIRINFQTEGAIAELVMNEGGASYYDLSKGELHSSSDGENQEYDFKYSNCYIIHPGIKKQDDSYYHGYAFNATVVGNGERGLYPGFDRTDVHIDPVRASLLWESTEGLITQVELKYGYVRFKAVNPGDGGKEGNAVIAVYDSKREVLWSWHIWITDTPADQEFRISDSKSIVLLDRNLGATDAVLGNNSENLLNTYGLYYQWGRKDPSMGPPSSDYKPMSTETSAYWDYYGDEWDYAGVVMLPRPEISDGVKNPMYLILPSEFSMLGYQYDWLYRNVDNLWGDYSMDAQSRLKTIYDPCPFGYMVPQDEITTIFSMSDPEESELTIDGNGMTIVKDGVGPVVSEMFFPFAGYKGADKGVSSLTGAWKYVGEKGDYMSSKIDIGNHRSRTYISAVESWNEPGADNNNGDGIGDASCQYRGYVYPDNYANRRVAASVRCVKRSDALNASIAANFYSDKMGYEWKDGGKVTFNYHIVSNQSPITTVRFSESGNDMDLSSSAVNSKEGSVEFNYPASPGLKRYSMTVTNANGVKATKWFSVYFLTLGNYSVSDPPEKFSYGVPYDISVPVNGIDDACRVLINGVEATENNDVYSADAYIAGHIMVEIIDPVGNVILTKEFGSLNMDPSSAEKFTQGDQVGYSTELESGAMYLIRAYNSPYDEYYWTENNGKLNMEKKPVEFDKTYVFIYHKDNSKGSAAGYASVTAGAWKSLSNDKFMDSSFTFSVASHESAQYFTCANNWGNSEAPTNIDLYRGTTGQTMYFNVSGGVPNDTFGWTSSVGSKDGFRKWVIYKAEPK